MSQKRPTTKPKALSTGWKVFLALLLITISLDVFFLVRQLGGPGWEADNLDGDKAVAIVPDPTPTPTPTSTSTPTSSPASTPPPEALPEQAQIKVPFMVQAPFANWDALHEDACEETSLLMVKHFRDRTEFESKKAADQEITDFVHFEEEKGYGPSITLSELSGLASTYLNLSTGRIKTEASLDDMKKEIAAGRPVIVGAAGKVLNNPNFSHGGPVYHMLVITGYDANGFITNDPGIRQGENFRYTYENLYEAMHDWDSQNINLGGKNYLVFD